MFAWPVLREHLKLTGIQKDVSSKAYMDLKEHIGLSFWQQYCKCRIPVGWEEHRVQGRAGLDLTLWHTSGCCGLEIQESVGRFKQSAFIRLVWSDLEVAKKKKAQNPDLLLEKESKPHPSTPSRHLSLFQDLKEKIIPPGALGGLGQKHCRQQTAAVLEKIQGSLKAKAATWSLESLEWVRKLPKQ